MGKSKDDSKRKRSSPSSPRDDTRTKRQKSKEDDKKHSSRRKHKSDQSSKRNSDKDKKSGGKHKHRSSKRVNPSHSKHEELSTDDYFSKNNEFALWLREEKGIFFSDLSADSSRGLFSEFVAEWNDNKLEPRYYEGITAGPRTSHKWNIKK
ncbi:style cell-cycle inhibitor 1-B [Andrographis paniculata]|uniref:style cell-cycle inhibitor 1-B n=1 Tax=Andrographis paniculata TaxID=175694 RepID=UPI0021E7F07E|nr:style cell-cycle inhibitor 1-B [Andrographis paniculata]